MAVAHLSVKIGKAGKGSVHAEYIEREGKYKQRLNQGEKLEAKESGNMPKWAENDPNEFWRMADLYERKNGSVYREHEIALPRELSKEQRIELVRSWVEKELGLSHAYTWAIHNKIGLDGLEQPHLHLMFSDRLNDGIERSPEQYFKRFNPKNPEKGGCKKANYQASLEERKEALKALRQRWENIHNNALSLVGIEGCEISMLSYAEQGIDKVAQPKMLPSESNALHQKNNINLVLKGYKSNGLETLTEEEQKTIRNYHDLIEEKNNLDDDDYPIYGYVDDIPYLDDLPYIDEFPDIDDIPYLDDLPYIDELKDDPRYAEFFAGLVYEVLEVKEEKLTIEQKLEALIASNGELSASEREEAKAEYEKRLKEARELEMLLGQSITDESKAKGELDETKKNMWRLKEAYEERVQMMADAEKRIAELERRILGKWRNGEEIGRLKAFLVESEDVQQQRRVLAEELEKSRQRLCETIDEANAASCKARADLRELQPAISAFGDLFRLAQVVPEKREVWQAEAIKRGKWYEDCLPLSRESLLDSALKRFEKDEQQKQRRGRGGFSR